MSVVSLSLSKLKAVMVIKIKKEYLTPGRPPPPPPTSQLESPTTSEVSEYERNFIPDPRLRAGMPDDEDKKFPSHPSSPELSANCFPSKM